MRSAVQFISLSIAGIAILCVVSCRQESAADYLNRGKQLYAGGKYQDAALAFRKAIQKDVRLGEAHYRYALTLIALDQPQRAITPLRRALTIAPDDQEVRIQLATAYFLDWLKDPRRPKERHTEIRALLDTAISRNPQSVDALRLLGQVAIEAGDYKTAATQFERVLAVRPDDPPATLALAQLRYSSSAQASEEAVRRLLDAHRTFTPAYDFLYQHYLRTRRNSDAEQILLSRRRALPHDHAAILQLARHYTELGQPERAKPLLDEMLSNTTAFPNAYLHVGDFYASRKQHTEALAVYERGSAVQPRDRKKFETRMANVLLAAGNRERAMQLFDVLLKRDASDVDARAARATMWLESGQPELVKRSVDELSAIVSDSPENASIQYALARAYLAIGNRNAASRHAREAARRDRGFVEPRLFAAELDLESRRPKEALALAVEALQIDPSNLRARVLLARSLQLSGRVNEAQSELTLVLRDAPQYRPAQLQMGYVHIDQRKFAEAERTFRTLFRSGQDDSEAMTGIVQALMKQNQQAQALQEVSVEVARHPKSRNLRFLLAEIASGSGKREVALQQYVELIGMGVKTASVFERLAEIQYGQEQLNEAIDSLRQACLLEPGRADLTVLLGSVIEKSGRAAEARTYYRKALALDPENAIAANNLAYSLAEAGEDLDEALTLATKASRLSSDLNFKDTIGWVYLKKDMVEGATQIFRSLVETQPANSTFRLHLAMALLAGGERQIARQELERALALNPPAPESMRIRSLLTGGARP